jgi:hypothetical protein
MTTLLICGLMLTLVAFGREHILLGFGRLTLSGPDIRFGCFDRYTPADTAPARHFTHHSPQRNSAFCLLVVAGPFMVMNSDVDIPKKTFN